jgi:uncharacterized membrane protein
MLFFGLIAVVTLLAALLARFGVASLDWRACMRWGLALPLLFAGSDHVINSDRYLPMMPAFVPRPAEIVLFTGLCEIAGGIGLLVAKVRRLAAIMLAIYFVCVFPANIKNAVEGVSVQGLPSAGWYYWIRLLFQPIVIWWALYAGGLIDWPLRRATRAKAERA